MQEFQTSASPPRASAAAEIVAKAARPSSQLAVQAAAQTPAQHLPAVVEVLTFCQNGSDTRDGEQ